MDHSPPIQPARSKYRKRNASNNDRNNPHVKASKALSWTLRHAAPELGLDMGPDGYVLLDQILNHSHPRFRGLTQEMVEGVVASSNKQRFALTKKDDGKLYIRANQGHSLDIIDPYQLLTPLSAEELSQIPTIVHGTYLEPWTKHIQNQGLSKMCRTHIHFAKGMPNDAGVISGMRRTSDVYIYVNAIKCAQDGIEFLESANGVLLTAGIDGMLATKYFSHVVSKSGEVLLDQRHAEDGQS